MTLGKKIMSKKEKKEKQYHLPYNIEGIGKNFKWEKGKGPKFWGRSRFKK